MCLAPTTLGSTALPKPSIPRPSPSVVGGAVLPYPSGLSFPPQPPTSPPSPPLPCYRGRRWYCAAHAPQRASLHSTVEKSCPSLPQTASPSVYFPARRVSHYSGQSLRFTPQGGGGRCGAFTASLRWEGCLLLLTTRFVRFRLGVWPPCLNALAGGRALPGPVGLFGQEVRCVCCLALFGL